MCGMYAQMQHTVMPNYKQKDSSQERVSKSKLVLFLFFSLSLALSPLAPTSKVGSRTVAKKALHAIAMGKSFQRRLLLCVRIPSLKVYAPASQSS